MRLNPNSFNRFLDNIGQKFVWRRAYACSCLVPGEGAPDRKCPHCHGKGHIWQDPTPCMAASAGQKTQINWAKMGRFDSGDIVLTVQGNSPLWEAGEFDRVTMLNASDRFSHPLTHGSPSERLQFTANLIDRVYWIDPITKNIVEGGIPTADANGRLTWTTGEPPPGMSYSISGTRLSEYFIFAEMPRNRNMHSGARLPKNMVLRRWDLLGR
jgi:hypothetical protein